MLALLFAPPLGAAALGLISLLLLLLAAGPADASVAYNFTDLNVTYYYDNSFPGWQACAAAAGGPGWSNPTIAGSTACGASIKDLRSNGIVALNVTWLNENGVAARNELCGREVQLWKDGRRVILRQGPFFLWDGCQACATHPRIDLSLDGYIAATGDTECHRGTVGGFDVLVMDNYIRRAGGVRRVPTPAAVLSLVVALALVLV